MRTTILYCQQCECEVEAIVIGSNGEVDGVTAEDDSHITEGHDLSGDFGE